MSALSAQLTELRAVLSQILTVPDAAWRAAESGFSPRRFEAGAHVLEAGTAVRELFFLTSGLARFYYLDARGREFNKSFAGPGQVLSSVSSLVDGTPSPFFVQALRPLQCLSIGYADFVALGEAFREWRQLQLRLLERLLIKKERREADFLQLSAADRYRQFTKEHADIAAAIPNYHIASYLGVTEVALSRIRRRLQLTGVNDRVRK